MSGFGVTTERLDKLAENIIRANEDAQSRINMVRDEAERVSASWKGNASVAFQNLINRFNDDAGKVQKALMDIATQISANTKVYLEQEQAEEERMSAVAQRLG